METPWVAMSATVVHERCEGARTRPHRTEPMKHERRAVGANEMRSLDLPSQPGRVQRLAAPESHERGDEI